MNYKLGIKERKGSCDRVNQRWGLRVCDENLQLHGHHCGIGQSLPLVHRSIPFKRSVSITEKRRNLVTQELVIRYTAI
jgi:hypothetical protein